jgi:hypothetical protein
MECKFADILIKQISQGASIGDTWDRCYDSKNIFANKFGEKMAFFAETTSKFLPQF